MGLRMQPRSEKFFTLISKAVSDWAGNAPEWAFLMANREPESGTKEFFNRLYNSRNLGE